MASEQKSMQFGTTEPGDDVLYVEIQLDASGVNAGDVISAYTAFDDQFTGVPRVMGVNMVGDNAGEVAAISGAPTSVGITLYAAAVSTGNSAPSSTFQASALVRGVLA